MIKGHGDDLHNYATVKANFSSNVCADGPHPTLVNHLKEALSSLAHYPEPCAESLTQRLAECHHLSTNQVLVCHGATEAFYLLANEYRGHKSLIFTPSFSEYEDACTSANHTITYVANRFYTFVDYTDVDLVWLCNPNNPDAFCYDFELLSHIIKANTQCLFIIDEAYIEFASGQRSFISLFATLHNVVVIRSMTKRYSIPALRLGYMVGDAIVIASLSRHLMPWRLNTLALKAGEFVLSSGYTDEYDKEKALNESLDLQKELNKIDGLEVLPSNASFFLAQSTMLATVLKQRLVDDYGLLIRDASNFRGLSKYHFRIAVQSQENNALLVSALTDIFANV